MKKKRLPKCQELFQREAAWDVEDILDTFFLNTIQEAYVPKELEDAQSLRLHLHIAGKRTTENEQLVRKLLRKKLKLSQQHSALWLQPDPDVDELTLMWERQSEANERWHIFITLFARLGDLNQAIQYAYSDYQPESLLFTDVQSEREWKRKLKQQQQRFIHGKPAKKSSNNKRPPYNLEPVHLSIMDELSNYGPVVTDDLIRRVYGQKNIDAHDKKHLSRRISEINKFLEKKFGANEQGRWIKLVKHQGMSAYQMLPIPQK